MESPSAIPSLAGLPPELKDQIVDYLDRGERSITRLISRDWAISGAKQLFKEGLRVDQSSTSMANLENASKHPVIATSITSIAFDPRDTDEVIWLRDVMISMRQTLETEKDRIKLAEILNADEKFSSTLLGNYCNEQRLSRIFSLLPCIKSIDIAQHISTSHGYEPEEIHSRFAWPLAYMRHRVTARNLDLCETVFTIQRYKSVLSAAQNLTSPICHLKLQALPVSFFVKYALPTWHTPSAAMAENISFGTYDDLKPALLKRVFSNVRNLRLAVCGDLKEYDVIPTPPTSLDIFRAMEKLRSLDLEWLMTDNPSWKFEAGMQKYLLNATLPCLESLRLERTQIKDVKLQSFLKRHSASLKHLHLRSNSVVLGQDRTLRHLFSEFRRDLSLKKFQYLPLQQEGRQLPLYNHNWDPLLPPKKDAKKEIFVWNGGKARQLMVSDGQLLEMFVIGKCTWPMESASPNVDTAHELGTYHRMTCYYGWRRLKMPGIILEMEDKVEGQNVFDALMEDEQSYIALQHSNPHAGPVILDIMPLLLI